MPLIGVRSRAILRNKRLKQIKQAPLLAEFDRRRQIRLTSYTALQKVRAASKCGLLRTIDQETKDAAKHGQELETNDEQKTRLRQQGHFFFVNPSIHATKDKVFPVVNNQDGKIADTYDPQFPEQDKGVKMKKADWTLINKVRGKKKRGRKGSNLKK